MPRGANPKSRENLKKSYGGRGGFDSESAKRAKIKSDESKRALKSFREIDTETTTYEEREEMLKAIKLKAKHGNIRAFEVYRDTVGERPDAVVEVNTVQDDGFMKALSMVAKEVWKEAEDEKTDDAGIPV